MDEYVGDVWNLDGLAIAEPGYMDPLSGFPRIKGSYRVSWKRNGRRVEGTLGIDGANVELRDNQGMIVSPVNPGTPVSTTAMTSIAACPCPVVPVNGCNRSPTFN